MAQPRASVGRARKRTHRHNSAHKARRDWLAGRTRTRQWPKPILLVLAGALLLGATGRAVLPGAVRDYVNRTLDRNLLYEGSIGKVTIHLWRGAYSIRDLRISKREGNVPVPFFAAKRVDFALQWSALIHGKFVGRVRMEVPELNFVDAPAQGEDQTGAGGAWLQIIRDLFPFKINRAVIQHGSIHFRSYQTARPVDVYLSEVQGSIDNLANIRDEVTPLVSTVVATGLVMGEAKFEYHMTLDPFSYRPTFTLATRLLGLDVTKINDLALAYGGFDFTRGWFDLVIEVDSKEGQLTGYVKPLFRDLEVFTFSKDIANSNPLQIFWEALVGVATSLFKNRPRDQFGTLIPFRGDLAGTTSTDVLATIANVLRNAFIRAYLPRLEGESRTVEGLEFGPPEFTDALVVSD